MASKGRKRSLGLWFRSYASALDNPKIERLSDANYRIWSKLLSVAAIGGGIIKNDMADLVIRIRRPEGKIRKAIQELVKVGLLECIDDDYTPHEWEQHQFDSDVSTGRVREFRERKRNCNVSPLKRFNSVSETNLEPLHRHSTEEVTPLPPSGPGNVKVTKPKSEIDIDGFVKWYEEFPRHEKRGLALKAYRAALKKTDSATLLEGAKAYRRQREGEEQRYTLHPASWLNAEGWDDETSKPAVETFEPTDDYGWRKRLESFEIFKAWPTKWGGKGPGDDPRHPAFLREQQQAGGAK